MDNKPIWQVWYDNRVDHCILLSLHRTANGAEKYRDEMLRANSGWSKDSISINSVFLKE